MDKQQNQPLIKVPFLGYIKPNKVVDKMAKVEQDKAELERKTNKELQTPAKLLPSAQSVKLRPVNIEK